MKLAALALLLALALGCGHYGPPQRAEPTRAAASGAHGGPEAEECAEEGEPQ